MRCLFANLNHLSKYLPELPCALRFASCVTPDEVLIMPTSVHAKTSAPRTQKYTRPRMLTFFLIQTYTEPSYNRILPAKHSYTQLTKKHSLLTVTKFVDVSFERALLLSPLNIHYRRSFTRYIIIWTKVLSGNNIKMTLEAVENIQADADSNVPPDQHRNLNRADVFHKKSMRH